MCVCVVGGEGGGVSEREKENSYISYFIDE